MATNTVYSWGALQAFEHCPRLYEYRYIQNQQTFGSEKAERGQQLHRCFDQQARGLDLHQQMLKPDEQPLWQAYLETIAAFQGWAGNSEWDFQIPLRLSQQRVVLVGRIDRWYQRASQAVILDWKTGDLNPSREADAQLGFYAWALWQFQTAQGRPPEQIETRLVWLKEAESISRFWQPTDLQNFDSQLRRQLETIEQTSVFPTHPQQQPNGTLWCRRCTYHYHCPKGKLDYDNRINPHEKSDLAV